MWRFVEYIIACVYNHFITLCILWLVISLCIERGTCMKHSPPTCNQADPRLSLAITLQHDPYGNRAIALRPIAMKMLVQSWNGWDKPQPIRVYFHALVQEKSVNLHQQVAVLYISISQIVFLLVLYGLLVDISDKDTLGWTVKRFKNGIWRCTNYKNVNRWK